MRLILAFTLTALAAFAQPTLPGPVTIRPPVSGATGAEIRLQEKRANGAEYFGWRAPDALAASVVLTGPTALPTSSQCIKVDTLGATSFIPCTGSDPVDYDFAAQTPGGTLTAASPETITLSPVPLGLNHDDAAHYLYISGGTGAAEAVLITGGTGHAGDATGTVIFTPANNHSGAWTIASASDGIQEAVIAAGYHGAVSLRAGTTYEIYAPVTIQYRVSILGTGQDTVFLHNNSATTGVIRYVAALPPSNLPSGGANISGFTMYSGAKDNTAADTTNAAGLYILGPDWNLTVRSVSIRGHATGIHNVNGWNTVLEDISIRYYKDYGIYVEANATLGTGVGADLYLRRIHVSNTGSTGVMNDAGCGFRFANWGGIYAHHLVTTSAKYGLCLTPRATVGSETYTHVYYGTIADSYFDTSEHGGVLIDSTIGSVWAIRFEGIYAAYSGCTPGVNCTASPFPNAAPGVWIRGSNNMDLSFVGGTSRENGGHGVLVENAATKFISFQSFDAVSNSQAGTNTYDGFHIGAAVTDVSIQNCVSGATSSLFSRYQRYGIYIEDGDGENLRIIGNRLGPSNATGDMYNGAVGVYNIITLNYPSSNSAANGPMYGARFQATTPTTGGMAGIGAVWNNPDTANWAGITEQFYVGGAARGTFGAQRDGAGSGGIFDWYTADVKGVLQSRVRINSAGQLLVGETSPTTTEMVEVNGAVAFPNTEVEKLRFFTTSGSAHYGISIAASDLRIYRGSHADRISFGYGTAAAFTSEMYMDADDFNIGNHNLTGGGIVTVKSHLSPSSSNTYDLGYDAIPMRWRKLWVTDIDASGTITGTLAANSVFTDRGDPAAPDLTQATVTIDSAWHDWDVSAIVPAGATSVLIRALSYNTGALGFVAFRKNGNSNQVNISGMMGQGVSQTVRGDMIVACDSSRVIEYYITNTGTYADLDLTVAGWWK